MGGADLTWREFGVLMRRLPQDSATVVEFSDGASLWGPLEYLVAMVVDVLQAANWQRSGKKKAKRPSPIPRPADMAKRREHDQAKRDRAAEFREMAAAREAQQKAAALGD